jgi:hypothetical protein
MTDKRPKFFQYVSEHWPIFLVSILLIAIISFFFLENQAAGEGWALKYLPLDDNWIHLVYARSLAQDGWFFYNPRQAESGMSSPLWVILLAVVMKFGAGPVLATKFLSIFFGLLFSIALYHLARSLNLARWLAVVVAAVSLLEPNMGYALVSGMEVTLTAFTLVAALWAANERA